MPTEAPLQSIVKGAVDQLARSLSDLGTTVADAISKSAAASLSNIATGVNSVNTTLGLIKTVIAGTLSVNAIYADGESNVYNGFSGTITGTGTLTVWTPATSKRFLFKGYAVAGVVSPDVIAAASGPLLYFADGGNSNAVVAPIAAFHKDAAPNTTVFIGSGSGGTSAVGTPIVVDLGSGRRGSATGSSGTLKIMTDITIGGGDIKMVGVVWGREV